MCNVLSVVKVPACLCLLKLQVKVAGAPPAHADRWMMLRDVVNPASPNIEAAFLELLCAADARIRV